MWRFTLGGYYLGSVRTVLGVSWVEESSIKELGGRMGVRKWSLLLDTPIVFFFFLIFIRIYRDLYSPPFPFPHLNS